jgi:uracil-DNA glycosylase
VACIPKDDNPRRKTQEPLPAEIASCWPRLDEFIDLCRPKVIVAVGGLAEAQAKAQQWSRRALVVPIVHPGAVLKMGVGQKEIPAQRAVVKLRDTFLDIKGG